MSSSAQYASTVKTGMTSISTANTNRDGTGTLGVVFTAGAAGARIDKINTQASGTTTAGIVRYYLTKGRPGVTITSITFSTTTATVTTAASHGLSTGNLITLQGALPDDYNVTGVAIAVSSTTVFTYTMATTPTVNATTVGYYSTTPAVPVTEMWREVLVTAITASGTVSAFSNTMSSTSGLDQGYLPLELQPGYSLRASTVNAEGFNCFASTSGDL
jgi:hypothetical protein